MFEIALFNPCIPQNTGNIIRLCANTGAKLHLIYPMAFTWDDKKLKRSGLDYHEFAEVQHHQNWSAFYSAMNDKNIWALTTKGEKSAYSVSFQKGDVLLFGSESSGLSPEVHQTLSSEQKIKLPMQMQSRSLNLSNSVAIILYEAIRQNIQSETLILA